MACPWCPFGNAKTLRHKTMSSTKQSIKLIPDIQFVLSKYKNLNNCINEACDYEYLSQQCPVQVAVIMYESTYNIYNVGYIEVTL